MPVGRAPPSPAITPRDLLTPWASRSSSATPITCCCDRPRGRSAARRLPPLHGLGRPVLTDSGGFRIFSLPGARTIGEEAGAASRATSTADVPPALARALHRHADRHRLRHHDGARRLHRLDRRRGHVRAAMERTHRWALRSLAARTRPGAGALRHRAGRASSRRCAGSRPPSSPSTRSTASPSAAWRWATRAPSACDVVALAAGLLPPERPRYLMGVGTPPDLLDAIARGVDMFDCIMPTTPRLAGHRIHVDRSRAAHARRAPALRSAARRRLRAARRAGSTRRAYLHHLIKCREPLAPRLLSRPQPPPLPRS